MPVETAHDGTVQDPLLRAVDSLAVRLYGDAAQRAEHLGELFLACHRVRIEAPDAFANAVEAGAVTEFLAERVHREFPPEAPRVSSTGGWLGTYIDANGRSLDQDQAVMGDPAAMALAQRAMQRALSIARAEKNTTLERNLSWYAERLKHRTYDSIARDEKRITATVRTGVARARKFVLRIVHEMQHAQPAPLSGEAPAHLEPLRQLWFNQELDQLAVEIERTRQECQNDPHWLNLAGLLAADRGETAQAVAHFEQALIHADAPSVRCRLLNNLGNLMDDVSCKDEARGSWLRAHQLVASAPAPLLNLLAQASDDRDYASAQHYLCELADLLNGNELDEDTRGYVFQRLRENPRYGWLRETEAWMQGPARWLRTRSTKALTRAGIAIAVALFFLGSLWPATASAATFGTESEVRGIHFEVSRGGKRGGDSMGGPSRRSLGVRTGGDSMPLVGQQRQSRQTPTEAPRAHR